MPLLSKPSSKTRSQQLAARPTSRCPDTHRESRLGTLPRVTIRSQDTRVRIGLCIYLRAGTAGVPGVGGQWSGDAKRGCRQGCGQECGQGCRGPFGAVTSVRRPHSAEGLAGARSAQCGALHLEAGAGIAGAGLNGLGTRCFDPAERRRSCSTQALLRGSGSPCSRSCAPAPTLRAPAVVLQAPAQAPRAPGAPRSLTPAATRLPSPRSVFIGFQCSKITGFPHCFLLFTQRHGNPWIPSISKTKGFPENFTLRNP